MFRIIIFSAFPADLLPSGKRNLNRKIELAIELLKVARAIENIWEISRVHYFIFYPVLLRVTLIRKLVEQSSLSEEVCLFSSLIFIAE